MRWDQSSTFGVHWNRRQRDSLTFPPQHMPRLPHFLIPVACFSISFNNSGTFFTVSGGLAGPAKKSPTVFFFSSVSGG